MVANTTRVDPAVRTALEVTPGPDTVISLHGLEACIPLIRDHVQRFLFEQAPIDLRLHKVSVYKPGGFFKRHVDTPRPNVLGTVVVVQGWEDCYDGNTSGGLVLYDPYTNLTIGETKKRLQVFAFYSNVAHEILPIPKRQKRPRVSVVFDIVAVEERERKDEEKPPTSSSLVFQCGLGAVSRARVAAWTRSLVSRTKNTSPLKVLCANTYSYSEMDAHLLKGCDADYKQCLLDILPEGTTVTIQPVVIHRTRAEFEVEFEKEYVTKHAARWPTQCVVYSARREDIDRALAAPFAAPPEPSSEFVEFVHEPVYVNYTFAMGKQVSSKIENIDYIGNEAFGTYFDMKYWCTLLVFTSPALPPARALPSPSPFTAFPIQPVLDSILKKEVGEREVEVGVDVSKLADDIAELQIRVLELAAKHHVGLVMALNGVPCAQAETHSTPLVEESVL
jgi:hypothetical protein